MSMASENRTFQLQLEVVQLGAADGPQHPRVRAGLRDVLAVFAAVEQGHEFVADG
jgi:hypothetical protein